VIGIERQNAEWLTVGTVVAGTAGIIASRSRDSKDDHFCDSPELGTTYKRLIATPTTEVRRMSPPKIGRKDANAPTVGKGSREDSSLCLEGNLPDFSGNIERASEDR
jgi:hypothetical protein